MSQTILLLEDEPEINNVIYEYLSDAGYHVIQAYNGVEGLMHFNDSISLIVSDIMMPKMNGLDFTEEIRANSDVPIILLTALADESDILRGYDLGVDEYVTKPFSPKIIVKKVQAILQRVETKDESLEYNKGILHIDSTTRKVIVSSSSINLSKKEFELLFLFVKNEGIVFSRDQILDKIWGYDYFGDDRVVDTAIKRLRQKMNEASTYIKTVFGVGYKFEVTQ
jgi:DNA-binding response OmpR family regulator